MNSPIVIFDSGVGGFSILTEILKVNLPYPIIYLGDQANFPYGEKSNTWLKNRLNEITSWILTLNPLEVIVACNTASVGGLQLVRSLLTCPVIGVDPVVKPASKFSKSLILGTSSTVKSPRLAELKLAHASSVTSYAPPSLPTYIENMEFEQVKNVILDIKETVIREKITAIGLSCTHFPLVKSLFVELIPEVTILDPSEAVAKQAQKVLRESQVPSTSDHMPLIFYTTGDVLRFKYQIKHFLNLEVTPERITL